jgi:hypothetical protein
MYIRNIEAQPCCSFVTTRLQSACAGAVAGDSCLYRACCQGQLSVVKYLYGKSIAVQKMFRNKVSLFICIYDVVYIYIYIQDPDTICLQEGYRSLCAACESGHLLTARYLCNRGGEELLMLTQKVS